MGCKTRYFGRRGFSTLQVSPHEHFKTNEVDCLRACLRTSAHADVAKTSPRSCRTGHRDVGCRKLCRSDFPLCAFTLYLVWGRAKQICRGARLVFAAIGHRGWSCGVIMQMMQLNPCA